MSNFLNRYILYTPQFGIWIYSDLQVRDFVIYILILVTMVGI